jgi:HemY protein
MKIAALAIFVALVLGGLIGTLLVRDPGYVLVSYGDTVVETSLWIALLFLLLAYALLRGAGTGFRAMTGGRFKLSQWRSGRKARGARRSTLRGLLVMAEGRWADAKKLLLASVDEAETPLINYLNAARAAHELQHVEERDELLRLAHEATPGARFAITLTQAQFQMDDGHHERALASLLTLRQRAPKHRAVLAMLAKCYEALEDWVELQKLLPELTKQEALDPDELSRLGEALWLPLLVEEGNPNQAWKRLPKAQRGNPALIAGWVAALVDRGRQDDAEVAARLGLGTFWDSRLVAMYGRIQSTEHRRQLVEAQAWAKERPNDAGLALALGRLSLMNEEFEQARDYFETSLRLAPNAEVYGELGRLCIALGDEHRGMEYLLRSLESLPDLPQPTERAIRRASVS